MAEQVRAAVRTGPGTTELREFPMPDIPGDGALLKVEVAGICGTDVKMYAKPPFTAPVIMGHENVGVIARAGRAFTERQGVREGDRVFVEHYVGCMRCEWCRIGEYRHCALTDWRLNPDARRYGYTTSDNPYHLWGGFAEYLFLPWNAVLHRVPDGVSAELAGIATPLSNGIEWALFSAGVGYDSTVLIQGPGQQGLSQTVACKQAGRVADHRHRHRPGRRADGAGQAARRRRGDRRDKGRTRSARIMDDHRRRGRRSCVARLRRWGRHRRRCCSAVDALKRRGRRAAGAGGAGRLPRTSRSKQGDGEVRSRSRAPAGHSYPRLRAGRAASWRHGRFPLDGRGSRIPVRAGRRRIRPSRAVGGRGRAKDVVHVSTPW